LHKLEGKPSTKKDIAKTAIHIDRNLLKESGGVQDQIWAAYGGLNTIEIDKKGDFKVKPLPVSEKFKRDLEDSMVLIYTNHQRNQDAIAKSHDNKDKKKILNLSRKAYGYFLKEDVKSIGRLLYDAWKEKRKISPLISNPMIDKIVRNVMKMGAHGVKLLGSGGCGFLLVMCDANVKKKILKEYKGDVLDFKFENKGTSMVYPTE
ncbi:MAG: hypothetical protein AAB775_01680, partial [Patescibacteria group bacterium]